MTTIAVDAGTSLVKAVVFDESGEELAVARRPVSVERPRPGWSEQDPEKVWAAVVDAMREVSDGRSDIERIAVTGQGDGCWLIDDAGRPTRNAILWNDGRAASIVERWSGEGILDRVRIVNGSSVFSGAQAAILCWLRNEESDLLGSATTAFYCKDWLAFKLTGERATDLSDASFPFLDIRERHYSGELLQLYGLELAMPLLPPIRDAFRPLGGLLPMAAEDIGLPRGVPVCPAPYDIVSTALGCGAIGPGQAVTILGTTLCNEVVVDSVIDDEHGAGGHVCMGLVDNWINLFATMSGTDAITWICGLLDVEPEELGDLATTTHEGAHGLTLLPYLSPAGERAPFNDPHARGTLYGLNLEHSREHVARAWFEALTFTIRNCYEASHHGVSDLRVCGGGAVNPFWCQLIADVVGVPVAKAAGSEVTAKGAALASLVSTGEEPSIRDATDGRVALEHNYEPRERFREIYDDLFRNYQALHDPAFAAWHLAP